jgi:hypothetical protein
MNFETYEFDTTPSCDDEYYYESNYEQEESDND